MGDFLGFEFDGIRSEELGITRVSGGDRFDEQLQPEVKDITAEVPGMDGEYYFGSTFGTRTFDIEIAYDSLTEEQFRRLRRVFGTKDIKKLVFDERPYKYYMVKIESPIELSYVCFDEQRKHIGPARDGVRTIGHNATKILTSERERIVVPASSYISYTLAYTPIDTVEISGLGEGWVEYVQEGTTFEFRNTTNVDRIIDFRYQYRQGGLPEYEQVTPWIRDEGTYRVYKGEGTISFVCYFPFAKSSYKEIPFNFQLTTDTELVEGKKYFILNGLEYELVSEPSVADIESYYERIDQESTKDWAVSSGILSVGDYEEIDKYNNGAITVYNAGDIATGFRLYLPAAVCTTATTLAYKINRQTIDAELAIDAITLKPNDIGVLIDTNSQLIVGVSSFEIDSSGNGIYTTTGNLYNKNISSGFFFRLEPNLFKNYSDIEITGGGEGIYIFYDYLYF